jgi:para-nitrobenzyl esterase
MQAPIYPDMIFRDQPDKPMSEDCLYLNVWTPVKSAQDGLVVMAWFYGGGFQAGSSSEPRYDGENFAAKDIIVVSVNYRLGVLGFLSHPELTKESREHASGNYGLMDQIAGLRWVKRNIAAFGGHAEKTGTKFAASIGAKDLAALRAKTAAGLLAGAQKDPSTRFWPSVDDHVLPKDVATIFAEGKQRHVPLLASWNAEEASWAVVYAKEKPTAQTFPQQMRARFNDRAAEVLKLYPASSDEESRKSALDLASDLFIVYITWKWLEMQNKTGHAAVYGYVFDRTARPAR